MYRNGLREILPKLLEAKKVSAAAASRQAEKSANFITKFLNEQSKDIVPDDLAPIARLLGMTVSDIYKMIEEKKMLSPEQRTC